jgi:hypothetical protein
MRFLGALRRARIERLARSSYGRAQLPSVLHRSGSEALLSGAEAQVQHTPHYVHVGQSKS